MTEREDFIGHFFEIIRRSHLDPDARMALDGMKDEIDRLREQQRLLKDRALVDVLTGIGNRRALEERKVSLETAMRTGRERAAKPIYAVVVVSADIIGLKHFNQDYSLGVGDAAIQVVAKALLAGLLEGLFRGGELFRRGGDEFVGLMPVYDAEGIEAVLEKLRHGPPQEYARLRSENPQMPFSETFPVLCATQVYTLGGEFDSLDEAELAADPKTKGRDRIISFEPEL